VRRSVMYALLLMPRSPRGIVEGLRSNGDANDDARARGRSPASPGDAAHNSHWQCPFAVHVYFARTGTIGGRYPPTGVRLYNQRWIGPGVGLAAPFAGDDASTRRIEGQLHPVPDAELAEDAVQVGLDGVLADLELPRHLGVAETERDVADDLL